jgi:hypothetical protein
MGKSDAESDIVLHSLGFLGDLQVSSLYSFTRALSCLSLSSGPDVIVAALRESRGIHVAGS